ncbi:MAG: hypothetical protein Q4E64_04550 [Phascolarctobacterium sp.]|uniref:hypothetical protein n=1 Tax=Phascolarctobacterium sp. TaxID=2049039 RepID=UPI0026DAD694|nr:hypothetical protein [Phascolarctobacterium sp.]MDO4921080.1 hypothetical protein [Phascolarctobacterium sp.]
MKKSAALAAVFLLCASQAWAYDNLQAGYSVQDKEPFYKMVSSKLYAYSSFGAASVDKLERMNQASVYLINYYTADEMESILGEKFSTAYFDKQYEQMALLQRSELDVRTVPSPLVDMERYAAHENKNNVVPLEQKLFKDQLQKLKPIISVSKISSRKAVNISYLYKQGDGLVAVDTSLLSANDRLYMLSTVTIDEQALAKKQPTDNSADAEQEDTAKTDSKNGKTTEAGMSSGKFSEALAKAMQVENVNPADIDKSTLKNFAKAHNKLVKSFKTMAPIEAAAPVSFTDATAQKTMTLPQDWFYGQIQFKEKEAAGTFTMAASLPVMQKIANDFDYQGMFALFAADNANSDEMSILTAVDKTTNKYEPLRDKAKEEVRKVLNNLDALLLACSIKSKDEDFKHMLSMSLDTELITRETLHQLQRFENDYFSLQKYSYGVSYKQGKAAYINIHSKINLLQDFAFDNLLRIAPVSDDTGSILFYLYKSDITPDEQITKDIDKWQF